jgi:hypothetical protein
VPTPDNSKFGQLEGLIVEAVRARTKLGPDPRADLSDREWVDRFVARVVVRPHAVEEELQETPQTSVADENAPSPATDIPACADPAASSISGSVISLPSREGAAGAQTPSGASASLAPPKAVETIDF